MKEKISIKEMTSSAAILSKNKFDDAKKLTILTTNKLKETAGNVKTSVSSAVTNVSNKAKISITEEQMQHVLNTLYIKSVDGIPKVTLPIDDLVEDYISKNDNVEKAAKSLINNSIVKCGTSGFLTGLGGFTTMIATLPANITSVMYVQLRMCCAIAKMAGFDIHSDQVQTLIYACLTGSAVSDILKQAGIKFGNKFGMAMVKKIPGKTIQAINKKVGFRFVTKFGQTGVINLGKVVPVVGGVIGGGVDIASTRIIGINAYKIFVEGEMPNLEKSEENIIPDVVFEEIEDVDTRTLENAINEIID